MTPAGAQTKSAASNAAVRTISELLGKVATLGLFVLAARQLGQTGFGVFAFALSFGLLLGTIPAWGYSTLMIQKASSAPESLDRLLTQTLVVTTLAALPVFGIIGGVVIAFRPNHQSQIAVAFLLAAALFEVWGDALRAAAAALQRQAGASFATVVQRFATAGLVAAVLFSGAGVDEMSAAYTVGTGLGVGTLFFAVHRLGVRPVRGSTRAEYVQFTRDSTAIGVDSMVAMALFRLDAVLLGLLATDAAVGRYAAAYRFLETILFLTWTVNGALFPAVAADPEPWRVRRAITQGMAFIGTAYVPFACLLMARPRGLLRLLYQESFVNAGVPVLRLLALAPLAFALGYFASFALIAREKRVQVLAASAIAAAVNVALNLSLIPHFEARGAAFATTVSYALEALVLVVWIRREVGLELFGDVVRPLLLPVIASVPFTLILLVDLPVIAAAVLGGLAYLVVLVLGARKFAPESLAAVTGLLKRSA